MPPERVTDDIGDFVYETNYIKLDNNALADIEDAVLGFGSLMDWQAALEERPYHALRRTIAVAWRLDQNKRADLLRVGALLIDGEDDQYQAAIAIAFMMANGADPTQASQLIVQEAMKRESIKAQVVANIEKTWLDTSNENEENDEELKDQTTDATPGINGLPLGAEPDDPSMSSGDSAPSSSTS